VEDFDVVVVGGGPAGSTVAWALRDSGLSVLLLDKQAFPRDKTCAGWITPAVIEALDLDLEDYRRERVLQPIHGFRMGMMGGRVVQNDYGAQPVSFGIRRCEFDHYLLARCGAQVRDDWEVREATREGDRWLVNGVIRARLLVGAGGHFCPVARRLGARLGREEAVVAAQEVEFAMSPEQVRRCGTQARFPELYFCTDLAGYGWVFRKGAYLNVGLGRRDSHRLGEHLSAFCTQMREAGSIPDSMPDRFKGHAYLLYDCAPRTVVGEGVMLVGDAAGLAYTQSGEGIRPAIESALLAAATIRVAAGRYGLDRLRRYQDSLVARFGPRRGAGARGAPAPSRAKRWLAARLLASPWFTRAIVTDQWFLHRQQVGLKPMKMNEKN
jgi:geranylgeranyl reductase family protein